MRYALSLLSLGISGDGAVAAAVAAEIEPASEADFQVNSRDFEKVEAGDSSSWRAYTFWVYQFRAFKLSHAAPRQMSKSSAPKADTFADLREMSQRYGELVKAAVARL